MWRTFFIFLWISCLYHYPLISFSYLHLDNHTQADLDDILDDPFLVLRTKHNSPHDSMNWAYSWRIWSQWEAQTISYSTLEDFSVFPSDLEKEEGTSYIQILASSLFDHTTPTFTLHFSGKHLPQYVHWQISEDPNFKTIYSNLNVQIPYIDTIQLSSLEETFLNPDQMYYLRVCTNDNPWSTAFAFQVKKPPQVRNIVFKKLDDHLYQLTWSNLTRSNTQYFVFASNALDFIPSVYTQEQINSICRENILEKETVNNLVSVTSDTSILIDGTYSYYRIIAYDQEHLGIPSGIIYIYDHGLSPERTHLKQDSHHPLLFTRKPLPSFYETYDRPPLQTLIERIETYPYNSLVPLDLWSMLDPFFLPVNHPIKARLDRLFHKSRVTQSKETFEKAGFNKVKFRQPLNVVIGHHPQFKDYIFKVYLDEQPLVYEWGNWMSRIQGAQSIRQCIKRHGFSHFTVPHKWIYPMPRHPSSPLHPKYNRKNFILIAENMHILEGEENLKAYKRKITPKLLQELYIILTEEGLIDSIYPDNVPFTQSGRLAFIDTEHHHGSPIPYQRLNHFLSSQMQKYWQSLIDK